MKLCWHDWLVHKQAEKFSSLRYKMLLTPENTGPGFLIMLPIINGGTFSYIADSLGVSPGLVVLIGMLAACATGVAYAYNIGLYFNNVDPWQPSDRSCLRCGKMKFDATKADEKKIEEDKARALRNGKKDARKIKLAAAKEKRILDAKQRYAKMIELHQRAC